ncbi:solute carrier family 26 (sodium-independent sulfate anion transporter), member 11 [Geosmithia morbida]|uniref:Solute carrier family 26 (Sodium-independent sulfate anion transporter), member 11 n=1 Tax=Geosmithia morbida TaxID=1094350 RepID=A0A9P4YQD3_9HYPO|nr:solute carrier family 26 (sodium-independent sulfate anion transporter), member 11 [Geosmithia morbida]KAF4120642.1 solute carrier family 26 (sodium-independent sulfate anion transporter), member 11 [Geosmithia morbida]
MSSSFKQKAAHAVGFDQFRPYETAPEYPDVDPYYEQEPTVREFLEERTPSLKDVGLYFYRLFPFLSWIGKYNLTWFAGDLIAGITVGAVVVPQGMAYAELAALPVEFGLYSSFMGVLIYWFFATSKDITIGPVAVMSLVTGNVVTRAQTKLDIEAHYIASALAIIVGAIITFLGLARLGWIVELIPLPAIAAFMTGSAITIAAGQASKILGISGVSSRDAAYRIIINTLKGLPDSQLDAALGLTALLMLYLIRGLCSYMAKKHPNKAKLYFFISTLRTAFVILLYTAISAGMNLHRRSNPSISILETVPRGFQHAAVPKVNREIIKSFVGDLPVAVIVMLIEHISISKSFGRVNNYTIDPSQELVAIGVSNLLGPFLGGYPATGSFSRTAIKSKAGVRTPFAGVITAIVVLLAVYALTAVFFYIPDSALGAVIFHAVGDVITPPRVLWQFWRVAPIDLIVFFVGLFVTIFSSLENGIYSTVCVSFAVLMWRLFLTKGRFLGPVRVQTVKGGVNVPSPAPVGDNSVTADDTVAISGARTAFMPVYHEDGSNPRIRVQHPYPGVFIYRFAEGFAYPNASNYLTHLVETIFKETRRTDPSSLGKLGDRPWNDGEARDAILTGQDDKPILRAVVLDFSTVNHMDATSAQAIIDTRNQLAKYAAPEKVEWHFANIQSRWTKRALASSGFGFLEPEGDDVKQFQPIFSVADPVLDSDSPSIASSDEKSTGVSKAVDIEAARQRAQKPSSVSGRLPTHGLNRPLFHLDLQEAVEAAITISKSKDA